MLILTEKKDTFSAGTGFFPKLAYASEIELIDAVPADAAKMASVVTGDAQIYMPMGDLIDFEAERAVSARKEQGRGGYRLCYEEAEQPEVCR